MQKVTLKFTSLHLLGECLFLMGINHPEINYKEYTLTAMLTESQIKLATECSGVVMNDDSYTIMPEPGDDIIK